MREILFRGKMSNGEWAYGNLRVSIRGTAIITPDDTPIGKYGRVDPESVGQYTGLTDRNGTKIFEGDVISYTNNQAIIYPIGLKMKGVIVFSEETLTYISKGNFQKHQDWIFAEDIEVIGNIHDNTELLEVADDG